MSKKYLEFEDLKIKGKTKQFDVWNEKEEILGSIKWHYDWRKYCFFSYFDEVFYDSNCLKEIAKFLDKLNKEHKDKVK